METPHDAFWDAKDMGCGELVIHLRQRLRSMPGKTIKVVATDPGAQHDIPAFCRMTGDLLVASDTQSHAYWITARG